MYDLADISLLHLHMFMHLSVISCPFDYKFTIDYLMQIYGNSFHELVLISL